MKRSFPINLAGKVYYIDEDAYALLDKYLTNLTLTFNGEEDKEIVVDIENRISEIFYEKISDTAQAITLDDVSNVIDIIGSPEQMAESDPDNDQRSQGPTDEQTTENNTASSSGPTPPPYNASAANHVTEILNRKFYRDTQDKVLGGVISGLCNYFNFKNVPLVRLLFVLAMFIPYLQFPLIFFYIISWLIFPAAVTAQQRLEMLGTQITVDNIGQTVKEQYSFTEKPQNTNGSNVLGEIVAVIAKLGLGLLALISVPVLFCTTVMIIGCIIGLICLLFISPIQLVNYVVSDISFDLTPGCIPLILTNVLSWCVVVIIPCITIIWSAAIVFFTAQTPNRKLIITSIVLEMIFLIIGVVLTLILSTIF